MKGKNTSYEDLSKLIVAAIEDEQFFDRAKLVPKVKAIMNAFKLNINTVNYNKQDTPSDAARKSRAIEKEHFEHVFWRKKIMKIHPDKMQEYFKELDQELIAAGFDVPDNRKKLINK